MSSIRIPNSLRFRSAKVAPAPSPSAEDSYEPAGPRRPWLLMNRDGAIKPQVTVIRQVPQPPDEVFAMVRSSGSDVFVDRFHPTIGKSVNPTVGLQKGDTVVFNHSFTNLLDFYHYLFYRSETTSSNGRVRVVGEVTEVDEKRRRITLVEKVQPVKTQALTDRDHVQQLTFEPGPNGGTTIKITTLNRFPETSGTLNQIMNWYLKLYITASREEQAAAIVFCLAYSHENQTESKG